MTIQNKRAKFILFFIVVITILFAIHSLAIAATAVDPAQKGSITIEIRKPDSQSLLQEAATVTIFHVANMALTDQAVTYLARPEFSAVDLDFQALSASQETDWGPAAATLAAYCDQQALTPTSELNGESGVFLFPDLEPGIYLIQYTSQSGDITVSPFLVFIPTQAPEGAQWHYDLTVFPKYVEVAPPQPTPTPNPDPNPDPNPKPNPKPETPQIPMIPLSPPYAEADPPIFNAEGPGSPAEKLPQTGLLRWPILLLGALGIALLCVGWVKLFRKRT